MLTMALVMVTRGTPWPSGRWRTCSVRWPTACWTARCPSMPTSRSSSSTSRRQVSALAAREGGRTQRLSSCTDRVEDLAGPACI